MPNPIPKAFGLVCLLAVLCPPGKSQCAAVMPTGAGSMDGSNWSNAMAGLPATLTRGVTYYLADGTYSQYTMNTVESGTTMITVKKATASDYGQNCLPSIATGWNAPTMGSSQAVFPAPFYIRTGYFTLDGQSRNSDWTGGGIKVDNNTVGTTYGITINSSSPGVGISNVTIQYVEVYGRGQCTSAAENTIYNVAPPGATNSNVTIQYSYIHDSSQVPLENVPGGGNYTIKYCLVARNNSSASYHGAGLVDSSGNNVTIAYNKFVDIVGTAIIDELNSGTVTVQNNFSIYGNLFYYDMGWQSCQTGASGLGNGAISCINGQICTNWLVYNNTFANMNNSTAGPIGIGKTGLTFDNNPASGSMTAYNNLWYLDDGVYLTTTGGATLTHDYNTFVSTTNNPTNETNGGNGSSNPFFNFAGRDFHLIQDMSAAANSQGQWSQGLSLSAPYNVDADGNTRGTDGTWDRGAYEFNSAVARPDPPQNLRVLSVQ